jgi:acetyl esterase
MTRLFFRPPKNFFNDPECKIEKIKIKTFDGKKIKAYVLTPTNLKENAPCLVNFHGGGFILDAAKHHYQLAKRYAIDCSCKVIFPKYRLAPKYKFPFAFEDCYSTLTYVYDNAEKLGIDKNNIGVGGDSAGGTLSVSSCIMAKDRKHPIKVRFQMLSYPFLDGRCSSRSAKKYTDTPMWNSTLSAKVRPYFLPDLNVNNVQYASPLQIKDYEKMPTAYIRTSPIPAEVLDRYGLTQRPCRGNVEKYRDVLIYRKKYRFTTYDNEMIERIMKQKYRSVE